MTNKSPAAPQTTPRKSKTRFARLSTCSNEPLAGRLGPVCESLNSGALIYWGVCILNQGISPKSSAFFNIGKKGQTESLCARDGILGI